MIDDILLKLKQAYACSFNPYSDDRQALERMRRDIHQVIGEVENARRQDDFVRQCLKNNFKQPSK